MQTRKEVPSHNGFAMALILIAVLFATGCARIPSTLPPEALAQIHQTEATSFLAQNDVKFQFMQSSYGAGGGLIGGIVDLSVNSSRAKHAERRAEELRTVVKDLDFRRDFWTVSSNTLHETAWLDLAQLENRAIEPTVLTKEEVMNNSVLRIGTSYTLSPNVRVMQATSGIDIYIPGKRKKPAASLLMTYHSDRIDEKKEKDEALELWIVDNGAAYRRAANEAIVEMGKMSRFALDIMGGTRQLSEEPTRIKVRMVHGRGDFGIPAGRAKLKGWVLEKTADRVIFKIEKGGIISLPLKEVELS